MFAKLFAILLAVLLMASLAGCTQALQPDPTDLKLTPTPNVASAKDCLITASLSFGNLTNYPGYTVIFTDLDDVTQTRQATTGANGKANASFPLLGRARKVQATAQYQQGPTLTSNIFTCSAQNPPD